MIFDALAWHLKNAGILSRCLAQVMAMVHVTRDNLSVLPEG
jgi:hypothetical protein